MARFLSAGEKPAVVFTRHTLSTRHYVPLPKAEMTAAIAQTVAGGGAERHRLRPVACPRAGSRLRIEKAMQLAGQVERDGQ
jgi:hypothetical protein